MEKVMFPMKNIRLTTLPHEASHLNLEAVDCGGYDRGIEDVFASFTGVIKKVYKHDAHEVWLESCDEVEFADGTKGYATMMVAHCNNIDHLYVGQVIQQGQVFYREGNYGLSSGNHCHITIAKSKFTGTGWHPVNIGSDKSWALNGETSPQKCFFIDDSYNVIEDRGYHFKRIENKVDKNEEIRKHAEAILELLK